MAGDDRFVLKPEPRGRGIYVVAAAVLVLLAGGYFAYGRFGRQVPPVAAAASPALGQVQAATIAVLPLEDGAAGDGKDGTHAVDADSTERIIGALKEREAGAGYFNDGLSAHFARALSRFAGVQAISPESSLQLRPPAGAPAIGRKLGATHLLRGSASRTGDRLRMDLALVKVADGATLWSERYERAYADLPGLQDEVVAAVAGALQAQSLAPPQGAQDERPPGGSLQAYDALLRGDALLAGGDGEGARRAIAAYERATVLDPGYAHAFARQALARIRLATRFPAEAGDVREQGEKARREAAIALRLAPDSAEAHKAQAAWLGGIALDPAAAMRENRRALALAPQDAVLLNALANQQTAFGQLDEAAGNLRRALALDPLSAAALYNLGGVYLGMNDYAEAEHALSQALELRPGISVVRAFRAIAVFQQNRVAEAVEAAESEPDPLWRNYALAIVHWGRGNRARADAALQSLIRDSGDLAATQIADVYAQRDDEASMFHWLDVAKKTGDPGILEIRYLPYVSRYSADPRFVALARELDLMPETAAVGKGGGASAE